MTDVNGTADEIGTDVTTVDHPAPPTPSAPVTLFRTDDPAEVIERASQVATVLKGVLDRQGLTATISGKRHVLVEGWTTLGAMIGVTAVSVWTRPLEGTAPQGRTFGYEARVEARTLDGRIIGAAEAMCTRSENRWKSADDYAIRSMAQTRATSKALRGPLGFVVTLAGYTATPAEEMPVDEPAPPVAPPPANRLGPKARASVTDALTAYIEAGLPADRLDLKLTELGAPDGGDLEAAMDAMTREQGRVLVEWLRGEVNAFLDSQVTDADPGMVA